MNRLFRKINRRAALSGIGAGVAWGAVVYSRPGASYSHRNEARYANA